MEEKRQIDAFGAAGLIGFASMLAFNQVVVKVTGDGFGPVFQAGLRSLGAVAVLVIWMRLRGMPLTFPRAIWGWGILAGVIFSLEFIFLYLALDLTTVSRASIIFYTMPVWLALGAHLLLPGERLRLLHLVGMVLAIIGVALALVDRSNGIASLAGDLFALAAALFWAGLALLVRATPLNRVPPAVQLLCQVAVSTPILLGLAPLFGPLLRNPTAMHWGGLAFQVLCIASLGYLFWFWLLTIYRARSVASFSFLSPVLAVFFGWSLLGENLSLAVLAALVLVAIGIYLINRR